MTSKSFHPLCGLRLQFLFLLLYYFPIYSDCLNPINNCKYEQIGIDSMAISCQLDSNTIFTDTICKADQLKEMKMEFDSLNYCFYGFIDTVIRFKTPPTGSPCHIYEVDSVHIKVIANYKGQLANDYWFLDTLIQATCDTNQIIWIEDRDPGYNSIKGTRFIVFTNVIETLRKSNVTTSGCFSPTGYFVDKDSNIVKSGFLWINTPLLLPIDYSSVWIKIPLIEFLNTLNSSHESIFVKHEGSVCPSFNIIQTNSVLTIRSFEEQFLTLTIYSLNGKLLLSSSMKLGKGHTSLFIDMRILHSGICLVKVSNKKVEKTFKINTW